MNRQALFDNFVRACNGNGQSLHRDVDNGSCAYFPDDHPGCAIGCQPGFRERFKDHIKESPSYTPTITELAKREDVIAFFQIDGPDDVSFLQHLQSFHDQESNWDGLNLYPEDVAGFAIRNGLTNPLDIRV